MERQVYLGQRPATIWQIVVKSYIVNQDHLRHELRRDEPADHRGTIKQTSSVGKQLALVSIDIAVNTASLTLCEYATH